MSSVTQSTFHSTHHYTDILIIGAGPAGLFAATTCALHGLKATIVEALSQAGGQCTALYPDKSIYDIPAYSHNALTGYSLIEELLSQVRSFNIPLFLNTYINSITQESTSGSDGLQQYAKSQAHFIDQYSSDINISKLVQEKHAKHTSNHSSNNTHYTFSAHSANTIFYTKYIILATGSGTLEPNKLILEGSQQAIFELESQGCIVYTLPQIQAISNKTLVILGGGDTALDYALHLASYAKHIYLIHRRAQFTCMPYTLQQLQNQQNITILTNTSLNYVRKIEDCIELEFTHNSSAASSIVADYIIPCYGLKLTQTNTKLHSDLQLTHNKFNINQHTQLTSMQNIYAIGDASYHAHKPKLFSILRAWQESLNLFN